MSKQEKLSRMRKTLSLQKADRVPISDLYWSGFLKKAKKVWGEDVDLYRKFDLDYVVCTPNMDPTIMDFKLIKQDGEDITVKTGFGATIMRRADLAMPYYESFSVNEPEEMVDFKFESPRDPRRLYKAGQDQINCLGDDLIGSLPSWIDRVNSYTDDFPVFGSINEGYEYVWRCLGTENALMWMLTDEEEFEAFMKRVGDFLVELTKYQIEEAGDKLDGMVVWGDLGYVNGMLFSPKLWRKIFKPITAAIFKVVRDAGLMLIYHGCGDARSVYDDLADIGLQAYHPFECKAHLDVNDIKKEKGQRFAFIGNIDVRELESGSKDRILLELLKKLRVAQDSGGYIPQADHSVSSSVDPLDYEYFVNMVKDYGRFPLDMKRINSKIEELKTKLSIKE